MTILSSVWSHDLHPQDLFRSFIFVKVRLDWKQGGGQVLPKSNSLAACLVETIIMTLYVFTIYLFTCL